MLKTMIRPARLAGSRRVRSAAILLATMTLLGAGAAATPALAAPAAGAASANSVTPAEAVIDNPKYECGMNYYDCVLARGNFVRHGYKVSRIYFWDQFYFEYWR